MPLARDVQMTLLIASKVCFAKHSVSDCRLALACQSRTLCHRLAACF